MSTKTINWGIIGLGKIAHKFAADLNISDGGMLHAVSSRSLEKAEAFKNQYKAKKSYDSYEALVNDPEIDVVYIATPHAFHFEHSLLCLKANKSVLCEKPMGMNAQQVAQLCEEASRRGLFLMEGLWTRFIPATIKALSIIRNGEIGDPFLVTADFGFKMRFETSHRLFNKSLGGGSLLDIGIYPVYLSQLALGKPDRIQSQARFAPTKVDSSCLMQFDFKNGSKAQLYSTIETETPTEAIIHGSVGSIKMHSRFHHAQKITVDRDGIKEVLDIPYRGNGYTHEIEEVHRSINEGLQQSPDLTWQDSISLSQTLDEIRAKFGLTYPTDSAT